MRQQQPQHNQPVLLLGSTGEGNTVSLTGSTFEQHKWITGISGSGKSTFLAWIIISLLRQGIALCVIDPHGDLCRLVLSLLASSGFYQNEKAFEKLWFVDFARSDAAISFNVLKQSYSDSHTIASNVLEAMHRAFPTSTTTASLDNVLLASFFTLAEHRRPVTDIQRLLLDASFRNQLLSSLSDPLVSQFFQTKFVDKTNSQLIDSTMRRAFLLTFSPHLRHALGQTENKLDFRQLMDNNRSCLFSLGGLDDQSKRLFGCFLMVGIEQAFLSRATVPVEKRFPYHVLVDEFPLFAASGDSFSVLLEQVRKYKGTLYLAHQTLSQLSKGMMGNLQNALPILMKAGTDDSSTLASRFYRPTQEEGNSFDFFSLFSSPTPSGVFATVRNAQEARMIFENLRRQEAIVLLPEKAVKIKTPTIPVTTNEKHLASIETLYARRLLTPLSSIEREQQKSMLIVLSSERTVSRLPVPVTDEHKPLVLVTGELEHDILRLLFYFHYLSLPQVVRLLQKESSLNYVRTKLKTLIDRKLVDTTPLAKTTAGKPPTIYYLTAQGKKHIAHLFGLPVVISKEENKHGYLEHTLACNDVLIASALLPIVDPAFTLYDVKHERSYKSSPLRVGDRLLVPDGSVSIGQKDSVQHIFYEIDRGTEEKEKIQQKIYNYLLLASQIDGVTIAFCVTAGGEKRVKQLLTWIEQAVGKDTDKASLFLCAVVSPGAIEPRSFHREAIWSSPLSILPHSLVLIP